MALAGQALAVDVLFKATSIYGGAEFNNAANQIIVYGLPASGNVFAGPASARFNVQATVAAPGTENVAGYGIIMEVAAGGPTFNITPLPASGTPNNLLNAVSNSFSTVTQNPGLNIILGDTNVPNQAAGNRSLGVVGLFPTANANTPVANNNGLFSVPITVPGGVTGSFALSLALGGPDYSGFAQTNGTIVTPAGAFPQHNQTIVVRRSRRADLNGDDLIDGRDIQPFVDAFLNFDAYKAAYPWLQANYIADLDQMGGVSGPDIQPFVDIFLLGGEPSPPAAVPEPSTLALGAMGFVALLAARFRRRKA
ncbi:MAG: PEP-CTERM sorting domain-containing protein [Pirellulales bacterium]